jgi:dihydrodipicolinate synthase/N-acetylneuraminate lyase
MEMFMKKKHSVVVISIIPFDESGGLDEAGYRRQLGRLRDAGCSVYIAGSSSSEAYTLSPEELDRVLAISYEELQGRVPYRAMGCEPRKASEMIEFMRHVERSKIGAAQIFSLDIGHGTKPSEAELEAYYSTIIEATSLKIYLSCHPRSIGFALPLRLIERLCDRFPQIVGIAYGGLDMSYLAELIHRLGDRLEIHNAGPAVGPNTLCLGGNGFMGGEGNLMPNLVQSVITAWDAEDREAFAASYGKLMRLADILSRSGGSAMRSVKPIMNAFGLPGGRLRPPRLPISPEEVAQRIKDIIALDIPGLPEPLSPRPYP